MTYVQYNTYANAQRALQYLDIRGPQVDRVVITSNKCIAIVWKHGGHSLLTHALFNLVKKS
jgi:hypothetical protein